MQPDVWEFMRAVVQLESQVAALRADVEWLTWAFRWLIGLQASTAGAAVGVVIFSWRNNNRKKHVDETRRARVNSS